MGTPGTICSPIPQRRHKYIISFHVRTLGDGGGEGQEIKYRKPQKYKRNLQTYYLMVWKRLGWGTEGSRGTGGGTSEAQNRKRPKEVMMSMQAPEKTQVNKHRPRKKGVAVCPRNWLWGIRECECVSVCGGGGGAVVGVTNRSNWGQEGVIPFPLEKASSILVPPKPFSGSKVSHCFQEGTPAWTEEPAGRG